jgi:hypothetical protein
MALTIYKYEVDKNLGGKGLVNNVQMCLYTTDPALAPSDTEAERKALAAAAVGVAVGGTYKPDYFATEVLMVLAAGTAMADDGDLVTQTEHEIVKVGVA